MTPGGMPGEKTLYFYDKGVCQALPRGAASRTPGVWANLVIETLEDRPEQIGNEEPSRVNQCGAPENHTADPADLSTCVWIAGVALFAVSQPRGDDIGHHEAAQDQSSRDAERPDLVP